VIASVKSTAIFICALALGTSAAQSPPQTYTDATSLLNAVAKTYAADAETFHFESISETVQNDELHRNWEKTVHIAIKAPGNRFRIEARTWTGTWVQVSDGTTDWEYQREANLYVKRPAGNGPQVSKVFDMGTMGLKLAWEMRVFVGATAEQATAATMLPEETIELEGHSYPCYVVHATSSGKGWKSDHTFWIEKKTLMFRKDVEHQQNMMTVTSIISIPLDQEVTTLYPVAELHPHLDAALFTFTPPSSAKEVATLEPEVQGFQAPPAPQGAGKPAPEVSLAGPDGKPVKISSFRGPCIAWMPSLGRLEKEMRGTGLRVISVDRDEVADSATHYMQIHGFTWPNYHDGDGKLAEVLGDKHIPLTVLIDAKGRIVYESFDSDEGALRKAIASLGSGNTAAAH
jgi:outer membrane lipoprotein-sorting protein/peroxiredoxin